MSVRQLAAAALLLLGALGARAAEPADDDLAGIAHGGPQLERALARSASFIEGDAGPLVSIFIDPDCGFCARLYADSRRSISRGRLRVRWIPVAVLGPDSLAKAGALLEARDPRHLPRPPSASSSSLPTRVAIEANNTLLSALTSGHPATPVLLMQRADGQFVARLGLPDDLDAFAAGG